MSAEPVSVPTPARASLSSDIAAIARIGSVPSILEVCCRVTGMGFAAVARVTETEWIACAVRDEIDFGLPVGGQLEIKSTLCDEIRGHGQPIVIDHVAEDPKYRDHHTPRLYGLQSYISMPIVRADGAFFGTLCAIHPEPAQVSKPGTVEMFRLFAELIAVQLDNEERMAVSEAALLDERAGAELREQFIAVLGHDLRNPLAAIQAGVRLLERAPLDDARRGVLGQMRDSALRMGRLIDDVLDFARGRLGGGLSVVRRPQVPMQAVLEQVAAELAAAHPGRVIDVDLKLDAPVSCDPDRISQLLSNLLGNALTHGDPFAPVRVTGRRHGGWFELSVANAGPAIPEAARSQLFKPFSRPASDQPREGLGLGLYIAAQIAAAHGGRLDVTSDARETRFTLRMPTA